MDSKREPLEKPKMSMCNGSVIAVHFRLLADALPRLSGRLFAGPMPTPFHVLQLLTGQVRIAAFGRFC